MSSPRGKRATALSSQPKEMAPHQQAARRRNPIKSPLKILNPDVECTSSPLTTPPTSSASDGQEKGLSTEKTTHIPTVEAHIVGQDPYPQAQGDTVEPQLAPTTIQPTMHDSLSSSSDLSSDSETVRHCKCYIMPNHPRNVAYVEQESAAKPPTLHPGDITPAVMREFEDTCLGYFENKEIPSDKQVRKVLAGLKDSRIRDWISTNRQRIQSLDFDAFMSEFRIAYLDNDWEEATRRELGSMVQGTDMFWDYAI
jgi:hypothetical protein